MRERDLQRLPGGELEAVVEVLAREDRVAIAARLEHGSAVEGAAADHRLAPVLRARGHRREQQHQQREREQPHVAARRPSTLAAIRPTTIPPTTQPSTISQPTSELESSASGAETVACGRAEAVGVGVGVASSPAALTGSTFAPGSRTATAISTGVVGVEPLAAQMRDLDAERIATRRNPPGRCGR